MGIKRNLSVAKETVFERPKPLALAGFTAGFVALSVGVPWATHLIAGPVAGRTFLPMHFFVLCAGLLLGWRSGLVAGLLSPIISFTLTGMPPAFVLLPLTLEITTYGLISGLLRRRLRGNVWLPLIGALLAGRIVVMIAISLMRVSPPFSYLTSTVIAGLPGIAIQIALLPLIARLFARRTFS